MADAVSEQTQLICTVCGTQGPFERGEHRSPREAYPCPGCRATLRYRDQAALIVDEFGRGQHLTIERLARSGSLDDIQIYEPALGGPFVKAFSHLPGYRRSYFWEGGTHGEIRDGVAFEDLTNLSFETGSIDMVLTSDVMEHVIDPYSAFKEIARVLKIGGVLVFSIPTEWPLPDEGVTRARIAGGHLEHIHPERYHRAGDGSPSLVVTDFGANIIDELRKYGLKTQIIRRSLPLDEAYRNATFIARKMY